MATKLHNIKQISSNSMQWNLKVRVSRMWEIPDRYKPEIPYSIELVLQDAKRTIVEETTDPTFYMDIFNLRPFDHFTNQHDVDEAELFDVVGQVMTYEAVRTYKLGDNKSVFMNIELEDDKRNRISATLWSELVDQIQPHLNASTADPLIVVLQLMKAQKYRGYSVRSCWYASKIWINPTFPQFIDFKSRYQLQVRVMDRTAFISLLLWNREAQQLIGKSAKELKEGLVETSDADADCSYPSELDDILDKKFMFKVIVKQTNIESQDEVYKVVKVTDDGDLLKEYAHSSFEDTITDPLEIPDGQISGKEKVYGDFVAESKMKSILQTPIKKSISESGSSVLEDGDDCNAKLSPLKTGRAQIQQDKRARFSGGFRGSPARGRGQYGRGQPSRPPVSAPPPTQGAPARPYLSAMTETSYCPPAIQGSSSGYSGP
ncbi:PREDICTED: uncharacterized protein LOC109221522 [Nicotiana attenuata]|uniref:uncharacterized protein LOC109221522 n=1 Tax=Nicotiana attenuata TaxID=49451 RepID=UPI000905AC5A|nr:PREDICTED: uncharacterized protein LOC109221522 [Nicotiana attenuata]